MTDYTSVLIHGLDFVGLTLLEIVLGFDNLLFITIIINQLPDRLRYRALAVGLSFAFVARVLVLSSMSALTKLTDTIFSLGGNAITWKMLIFMVGGVFLVFKAISEIHASVFARSSKEILITNFWHGLTQIVLADFVFSIDSVITAIGISNSLPIMISAITIAMIFMLISINKVSAFIARFPTIKLLSLEFILLLGGFLMLGSCGYDIGKSYLYFAFFICLIHESLIYLSRINS